MKMFTIGPVEMYHSIVTVRVSELTSARFLASLTARQRGEKVREDKIAER